MTIHQEPPRVTRVAIRLPAGMSFREALAAKIEALINRLDAIEPDPDLEENGDLEPSIGTCFRGVVDAEGDNADDEPDLGASAAGSLYQDDWSMGADTEQECEDEGAQCDDEGAIDADREPSLGFPEHLGRGTYGLGGVDDRELDFDEEEGFQDEVVRI